MVNLEETLQEIIDLVTGLDHDPYAQWSDGEKVNCLWIRYQAFEKLTALRGKEG